MKHLKKPGALLALVMATTAAAPRAADLFHFALARSVPAADSTVPAAEQVQLWFTQVPQDGSLTVRLVDSSGELVETQAPKAHQDDAKAFDVKVAAGPLPAGAYTVAWRGIGDDGHAVQSEFGFTVSAAAAPIAGGGR